MMEKHINSNFEKKNLFILSMWKLTLGYSIDEDLGDR
jgi:hypothetical protein